MTRFLTNEYIEFDTESGFFKLIHAGKIEALQLAFDSKTVASRYQSVLYELFESIMANSEYAYIDDISNYGALSNAEGIGLMICDNEFEHVVDEEYPKVFWRWNRYQIISLLEELIASDGVFLTRSDTKNE